jgi:NADH:ubiquinone oxidoreductase subunit 4 (subunit M)
MPADPHASHEHSGFHMPDLNGREWAALVPMVVLMIWMGVAAQTFLPSIGASTANILSQTKGSIEQNVKVQQTGSEVASRAQ